MERSVDPRLTILTFLFLVLIGLLVCFTGLTAVSSEKQFFRHVAFETSRELARMVAREFVHVFRSNTAIVDSLSRIPSVKTRDLPTNGQVFHIFMQLNKPLRVLYLLDPLGQKLLSSPPGIDDFRPLSERDIKLLTQTRKNYLVTSPYQTPTGELAITYATKIMEDSGSSSGILAAELQFSFLAHILRRAQIGSSGSVLVVDSEGKTLFTSGGFREEDREAFKAFPLKKAFQAIDGRGSLEYGGSPGKLASFARIKDIAMEPIDSSLGMSSFPFAVAPGHFPDWLIVVSQNASEVDVISERMKWNIAALVLVGILGTGILAKLWMDSLAE